MRSLDEGVIGEIEQHKDNEQYERQCNQQPVLGPLLIFVLAAPFNVIARRQFEVVSDGSPGLFNETDYVLPRTLSSTVPRSKPFSLGIIEAPGRF
jgi:hypothetical protein